LKNNAANTYGIYAATDGGKLSVVIVNKDVNPLAMNLSNVPKGYYFMRHFGGASGVAKWQVRFFQTISMEEDAYFCDSRISQSLRISTLSFLPTLLSSFNSSKSHTSRIAIPLTDTHSFYRIWLNNRFA
jgi:hypothetical protein